MAQNTVTLRDGTIHNVTDANYRDLARRQIDLGRAADPTMNVGQQSAILTAFKQLAGMAPQGPQSTAPDAAAQRVMSNPLVRASDAIMSVLPGGFRAVAQDSSDATVSLGTRVSAAVQNAAYRVKEAAQGASGAATLAVVAFGVGATGFLIWSIKK